LLGVYFVFSLQFIFPRFFFRADLWSLLLTCQTDIMSRIILLIGLQEFSLRMQMDLLLLRRVEPSVASSMISRMPDG
jgi:hypothetical protein